MTPKILLIGVGRFGKNHLRVLQKLHQKKKLILVGAVVKTPEEQKSAAETYKIPVFTQIPLNLLKDLDGVDIVTPYKTHFNIAKKCIRYTNVFVEKPLAATYSQAVKLNEYVRKYKRVLMVGHIYRFHPAVQKIRKLISELPSPKLIEGKLISPLGEKIPENITLELLHWFDVLDYIFGKTPIFSYKETEGSIVNINLEYPDRMKAVFELGYGSKEKIRSLNFHFSDKRIFCDFVKNEISVYKKDKVKKIPVILEPEPLEKELSTFVELIKGRKKEYPGARVGARIVKIIENIKLFSKKKKPKVAIIGAGVFGTTCAVELGKFCKVEIFEKNKKILSEASYANQYRHHLGYHYPRSSETAQESLEAQKDFKSLYAKAIISNFPSYYCVAKKDSKTSAEDFLKFCRNNRLPIRIKYPPDGFINKKELSLCLETPEGAYHHSKLVKLISFYLLRNKNIKVHLNSKVVGGKLADNGQKILFIRQNKTSEERFDYVINATYAYGNQFAHWFGFPMNPMRMSLKEIQLIRLPAPRIAMTVMDGPFATLVTTGEKNIFTLGHVSLSVHKKIVPKDGLTPKWKIPVSRWKIALEESKKWYPILGKAEYLKSLFVVLGVKAYHEYDDNRTSDIISHGFGCWSILGGKIVTCVSTAKTIALFIRNRL